MIRDLMFLFWDTPLKIWGCIVFGGLGALMGHLIWFVSQDRLDRLMAEQERLRAQIESAKKKLAERERMKRESTWKSGTSEGGLFAGWKGFARWLEGAPEGQEASEIHEEEPVPAATDTPAPDDFTRLEGVDESAAERLRSAGVTSFQQLAELESMTPDDRDKFAESFGLAPIPLDRWRWAWTTREAPLELIPAVVEEPEPVLLQAGPVSSGMFAAQPAPEMEAEPVTAIATEPVGSNPEPASVPKIVRPATADDLTRIRGIDSPMQELLNREGVFHFEDIAGWTAAAAHSISDRLDLADRIMTQRWTTQAAELARGKNAPSPAQTEPAEVPSAEVPEELAEIHRMHYAGETGSLVDPSLGVIYRGKPDLTDDLKQISGIDALTEDRLNQLGIFRFKQVADWTGDQILRISPRLGLPEGRIEDQRWVEQARRLHKEIYPVETSWDEPEPELQAIEQRVQRDYAGEPVRVVPGLGIIYHTRPLIVDDLQRIRGIGPVIEQQLHNAGIFRFKQVAGWAQSHVREVAKRLNCFPDRIYRDKWIPQARDLARVAMGPWLPLQAKHVKTTPPPEAAEEPVIVVPRPVDQFALLRTRFAGESRAWVDPRLGILYPSPPAFLDDLTEIERIDEPLQARLHSMGIYRFKQIASWSDENATEIALRLGIEKIRLRDENWPEQAEDRLADLYRLESGWDKARPSVPEYEQRIREQFPSEPVKADEEFGIVYTGHPARVDDLAVLEGIDPSLARRLNASGVYRFRQLANWSTANVEAFAKRLGFSQDAPYYQNWVGQALRHLPGEAAANPVEPELKGPARIARETGAGYNEQFGYLYPERPAKVDDLRAIRGVDVRLAGLLNHQGIYRFWQIEHWTNSQRDLFAQRLGLGRTVVEQRWKEQCRRLAILSEAQHATSCPAPEELDQFAAVGSEFAGEAGVRVDPKLGIVYDQRPPVMDPLTMIQGLDPRHEQVLQSLGIFRFKQIANWKDENVVHAANRLALPKDALERGKWIAQAIDRERMLYVASSRWALERPGLAEYERLIAEVFPGESVRADEELGVIFTGTPSRVDELRRIQGIDAELESRLNAAGVFSFRQIGNWSTANVDAFARLLRIPRDRIYVQRWIAQSQAAKSTEPVPATVAQPKADVDYFSVHQREFAGESGVRVDRLLGIVYDHSPGDSDPLTLIPGLEERHQVALNQLGIFRFRQIAHWSPATVREVARRMQVDPDALGRAAWPDHAARLHAEIYRASSAWSMPRPAMPDYESRIPSDFPGEPVFADEELGILYRGRPGLVNSLQRIQGISPDLERQLNAAGVFRFRQIALWSEANVEAYERFLGCSRGRIFRQRWIPQAEALAQEHAAAVPAISELPPATPEAERLAGQVEILERMFAGDPGARVDRRYGIVYGQVPEIADELTRIREVSPQWQTSLNQLGIFRFKQVAHWTDRNMEEVEHSLGTDPGRIRQEDWRGQAIHLHNEIYAASPVWTVSRPSVDDYQREIDQAFAGEQVRPDEALGILYAGEPGGRDDLTRIQGIDSNLARGLNASGVYRFKQISRWSEANVEAFAGWLGCSPDRIYRDRWIPQSAALAAAEPAEAVQVAAQTPARSNESDPAIRWDDELGYLYREEPKSRDDLKVIRGIDHSLSERLAGYGIFRFWQIARWSPDQAKAFTARLQRGKLVEREEWVSQAGVLAMLAEAEESERYTAPARVDQFDAIDREFAGEFGVRADPAFGIVYGERPDVLDDLTRIGGLTGLLSEKLHQLGVFRFKQVANWSDGNVRCFAESLGIPKDQIETQKWLPQARKLHLLTYQPGKAWTVSQPTVEEYEQRIRAKFPQERVQADPDCGIIYVGRPSHVDDLTDVEGIDAAMARRLHATGVYCFRQLENWAASNVRALAERLEISPERVYQERWIHQAENLPCQIPKRKTAPEEEHTQAAAPASLEDEPGLKRDERFGLVFRQRPAKIDALRAIKGVGAKIERRLNDLGIFRYRQMANWNERQAKEFAERLHLWGRIERERWVDQARELAELTEAEALDVYMAPERVDQMAILDSEFAHEASVRVDPYLGIVFDEPPTVVDDLSLIDGIGRRLEEELNHLGVYRYNQIGAWSAVNVAHFARHLFCEQERIERDKWIPQARRLYRETYSASWAWGVSNPSMAEYQARIEEEFSTEAVRAEESLGVIYTGWPSHVDDFTRIQGVSRDLERSLNRLGVFTFEQIANWAEGNVEEVAGRLGIAPQKIYRDRWITQAADLAGQDAPLSPQTATGSPEPRLLNVLAAEPGIEVDEQFGLIYCEAPRHTDSLTSIRGIGSNQERELNKLGIYRHRQIACWTDRNVKAVSDRLHLGGRIEREHWIPQAKDLTALAEYESGRFFVAPVTVDQESVLEAEFAGENGLRIDPRLGILYELAPDVKDDLTQISGVGPRLEEELNELGVYRFKQVGAWSDGNVGEFAQRLFCYKDRIERDKWVPQARRLHREIYRASPEWGIPRPSASDYEERISSDFPGSGLQADREYGLIYRGEPEWADPLTRIQGITSRVEEDLKNAGVYTYGQIAYWSEACVEAFASRLRIPCERMYRDRWIPQAARLWEDQRKSGRPERPFPWTGGTPVSDLRMPARAPRKSTPSAPITEDPSRQERLTRDRQEREERERQEREEREARKREAREAREREEHEAQEREREERERAQEEARRRAEEAQRQREERERAREEKRLRDEKQRSFQEKIQREAAERAEQIRRERREREAEARPPRNPAPAESFVRRSDTFEGPREVESVSVIEHEFAGEWGVGVDEDLGILYEERPEVVDDLKLIRGLSTKVERELNSYGVYRFKQIGHWSDHHVSEFAKRLDISKERIEKDKWVPQAKRLHRELYSASTEWGAYRPGIADYRAKIDEEFPGEDVVTDADLGIIYRVEPPSTDDLTSIRGVTREAGDTLRGAGIFRFKQVANWSEANVAAIATLLGCSPERIYRDRWISQARSLAGEPDEQESEAEEAPLDQEKFLESHFEGEDVVLDGELGIIYHSAPGDVDDLKVIRGIGQKIEQSLNDYGVYQYRQIALWTRENAEEFASRLNAFKDRIFRDNWMKQARLLHEEKYGVPLKAE